MLPLWVLIGVGVIGALLLAWALAWDRARGRARCPKCWYDRGGLPSEAACPECGLVPGRARSVHRTRRRWRVALLGLLLASAPAWNLAYAQGLKAYYRYKPRFALAERLDVAGLTVERHEWAADWVDHWEAPYVEVRSGSRVLLRLDGVRVGIGGYAEAGLVGLGEDITGDGEPNLILTTHTGGMKCCQTDHVYAIDARDRGRLVPLATLNRSNEWIDADGDGVLEHRQYDDAYAYRWTSGAGSPYPVVMLRWDGVRYAVAVEAMRRPAPTEGEFAEMVDALCADVMPDWEHRSPFLHRFFDLVYSGNAVVGWRLLDACYPAGDERDELRGALAAGLTSSRYREALRALNAPADPLGGGRDPAESSGTTGPP